MKTKSVEVIVFEAGKNEGFIQNYPQSPSLKDMQELVGGWIELIYLKNGKIMVVNEEGHLNDLPFNKLANDYLKVNAPDMAMHNVVVGNVFVINQSDFE